MEAVGGVAATIQLATALGTTVLRVSQAYSQITCMDDLLHDFDVQLDATRTVLSIFDDGIGKANFSSSTDGWWRQSELERLLRSCHQHYQRLNDIFNKIARQRSSAPALRAWIRTKRYDQDISHLRLCINTCTNALQLPFIIYRIHASIQVTSEAPIPAAALDLLQEVAYRLSRVETSVERTRKNLDKQKSHEDLGDITPTSQSATINQLIEGLDINISTLVASHCKQGFTSEQSETEARLAQMQYTISRLRTETSFKTESPETSLDPQDIKIRKEMQEDTRSMLGIMGELVDSTKDYISTVDSMSTADKTLPQVSQVSEAVRDEASGINLGISLNPALFPPHRFRENDETVVDWVNRIDANYEAPSISALSGLPPLPPSITTATMPATQSVVTATSGKHIRHEIRRRRIRAVEDMMNAKSYARAIVLLELLLSDTSERTTKQEQDRLYDFMAKAIVFGKWNTDPDFYARFPPLESMVTKARHELKSKKDADKLAEATEAFERGDYDRVLEVLGEYQGRSTGLCNTASLPTIGRETMQKIQLAYGQSLLYSRAFWDIAESIRIMEALLEDKGLGGSDSAIAHRTLARAYQLKPDYVKSKFHGEEAYQIMQDFGHDNEEVWELIEFMVRICSEAQDPDWEFWSEMIPGRVAVRSLGAKGPFKAREGLETSVASDTLRHIRRRPDTDGGHTTGLRILESQYSANVAGCTFSHNILCWDCLKHYSHENPIADEHPDHDFSCQRHQVHGDMTRGFSIMHFFAIAQPITRQNPLCPNSKTKLISPETTDSDSLSHSRTMTTCDCCNYAEDCVDEISILIRNAKHNGKGDISWARSRSIDTGAFRMHDLVNRPMDLQPAEGSRGPLRAIVVTPVWAAALSGRLSAVSFFLSLSETDVTRGSESIFLLQRSTSDTTSDQSQSPPRHQHLLERLKTKRSFKGDNLQVIVGSTPGESIPVDFQNVLQGVLNVFNALPHKAARQLFSCIWQPDYHWAFVDALFLAKVLDKCGEDSADLCLRRPVQNSSRPQSKSALSLFLNLMALGYVERFPWAEAQDLKSMLRTLLEHSQETGRDSSSKDQSMAILIDHIHHATEGLVRTKCLASYPTPAATEDFCLWIDMLQIYIGQDYSLSIGNRSKLQGCIDQLDYCEERLAHIRDWESAFAKANEGITGRKSRWSFAGQFKELNVVQTSKKGNSGRLDELMQKKPLLEKEKVMLEGGMVVRDRLKDFISRSSV